MGSADSKISKIVTPEELATAFRELADSLEGKDAAGMPDLKDFSKIKIGVKNDYGQITLKVKVKSEACEVCEECGEPLAGPGPEGKPKYKSLKKRMKSSFKVISSAVNQAVMPPQAAIEAFIADSRLMITYPGYGDEFYAAYDKAVDDFETAVAAGDMAAMHAAVHELNHQKSVCHDIHM